MASLSFSVHGKLREGKLEITIPYHIIQLSGSWDFSFSSIVIQTNQERIRTVLGIGISFITDNENLLFQKLDAGPDSIQELVSKPSSWITFSNASQEMKIYFTDISDPTKALNMNVYVSFILRKRS